MNYILNSLEEIRKVYTPNIEYLNTPVDWIPFTFCGIEKTILESMRFYQYYYYGDDYEKEDLSLKDFSFKNKSHRYSGLNYDYLLKNIDLEVFKIELEKLLLNEENYFILKINEELSKAGGNIEFVKRLRKDVESLVSSSKYLKSVLDNVNKFDKIIVESFIVSYRKVYDSLQIEHEQDIVPVIIFKPEHFKMIDDLKKSNYETIIKTEIPNLFPDIFKSIDTYNYFIEYNDKHIVEPFIDYSYLFQRLLKERLIYQVKHFEFMDWLLENKLISDKRHNEFKIARNFRTLAKSCSIQREQNFNTIFKR